MAKGNFARRTVCSEAQTKGNIRADTARFGGTVLDINEDIPGRAIALFKSNHAVPRFMRKVLQLPVGSSKAIEQARKEKWRALHLVIKAKFVEVETGITTFDHAFMAWIIGADGKTLEDFDNAHELRLLPPSKAA